MIVRSRILEQEALIHGFSTRRGGVSTGPLASLNTGSAVGDDPAAVAENLRLLAAAVQLPVDAFRSAIQVHGDRVVVAGKDAFSPDLEADALIGVEPGIAVSVKTADCVPILLACRRTGEVAAIHAGWRGTLSEISKKTVAALVARGSHPAELLAAIGPAIGPCCYEVSDELASSFRHRLGGRIVVEGPPAVGFGEPRGGSGGSQGGSGGPSSGGPQGGSGGPSSGRLHAGGPHLDLALANRLLLLEAGLAEEAIESLGLCTSCDEARFFSHRRDAGRTGRHLSFIAHKAREGG